MTRSSYRIFGPCTLRMIWVINRWSMRERCWTVIRKWCVSSASDWCDTVSILYTAAATNVHSTSCSVYVVNTNTNVYAFKLDSGKGDIMNHHMKPKKTSSIATSLTSSSVLVHDWHPVEASVFAHFGIEKEFESFLTVISKVDYNIVTTSFISLDLFQQQCHQAFQKKSLPSSP